MFTESTHPTPLRSSRTRLRRLLGGLVLGGVTLTSLALAPAVPAGAQSVTADAGSDDAARQVAQRRSAEYRRQAELAREQQLALAAFVQAQLDAARVAPVLDRAPTGLGRPYARGAAGPGSFDCSGFTRWAWEAAGVELPHYSGAQWAQTDHIAVDDLAPGDIVFFWGPGERGDPGHVGLYVGDGQMIHAPGSGQAVRYDSIWYWRGATVAAGRVR
jgi:cell wall-associated NlpC family hydrolase